MNNGVAIQNCRNNLKGFFFVIIIIKSSKKFDSLNLGTMAAFRKNRSSSSQMFYKKEILKNFANSHENISAGASF